MLSLNLNANSVQALIFIFLLYGVYLVKKDTRAGYIALLDTLPDGRAGSYMAKCAAVAVFAALVGTTLEAVYLIMLVCEGASPRIFGHISSYFLCYYFLPMMIAGFLGIATAGLLPEYAAVFAVLVEGVFIGPLNGALCDLISTLTHAEFGRFSTFMNIINLGQKDASAPAGIYQLPVDLYLIGTRVCVLLFIALLMMISVGAAKHVRRGRIAACMLFIVSIVIFNVVYTPDMMIRQEFYPDTQHSARYDLDVSVERIVTANGELRDEDGIFIPSEYDVTMSTEGGELIVECRMTGETEKNGKAEFTLYRDLVIEDVYVDGVAVEYYAADGFFTLESDMSAGERHTITVEYHGRSSPQFPADEREIELLGEFPWLPVSGHRENKAVYGNSVAPALVDLPDIDIEYILHAGLPYDIAFVSIERVGENEWRGVSGYGLTLLSHPLMGMTEHNGHSVYYPLLMEQDLSLYLKKLDVEYYLDGLIGLECVQYPECAPFVFWPMQFDWTLDCNGKLKDGKWYLINAYGSSQLPLWKDTDEEDMLFAQIGMAANAIQSDVNLHTEDYRAAMTFGFMCEGWLYRAAGVYDVSSEEIIRQQRRHIETLSELSEIYDETYGVHDYAGLLSRFYSVVDELETCDTVGSMRNAYGELTADTVPLTADEAYGILERIINKDE